MSKQKSTNNQAPITKELQEKVQELTELLQRERADSVNIRRRHEEQMSNIQNIVKSSVVKQLLTPLDSIERALKQVPAELKDNDYVKGIQGVVKQFEQFMAELGVERIKTVGEVFDPHHHEAVAFDQDAQHQDDSIEVVCEELQPGYLLGNEVIRHAMVKVRMESAQEEVESSKGQGGEPNE